MEGLAPPQELVGRLLWAQRSGISIRHELKTYTEIEKNEFARSLARWLFLFDQGREERHLILDELKSDYRQALVETIEMGLSGFPILDRLQELDREIALASELELDQFIATLPFKLMIPVFGLILPALMIILLAPLLQTLLKELR